MFTSCVKCLKAFVSFVQISSSFRCIINQYCISISICKDGQAKDFNEDLDILSLSSLSVSLSFVEIFLNLSI